jgi:hypothetical protein
MEGSDMTRSRRRIELPVPQWHSNGWVVEKRRGVQDTYEVTHQGEFVAAVVVTRAGWKWTARNHRSRSYRRPWIWSDDLYRTWQDAVAAYAAVYRRLAVGRGASLPTEWRPNSLLKTKPWTPKPLRDGFEECDLDTDRED